jgi:prolyl oligopeptidase
MKITFFKTLTLFAMVAACTNSDKFPAIAVDYPFTKKIPVIDNYFGTEVIDNYRWLEDDRSENTEEWVENQNEVTYDYLSQIPFREAIRKRFDELANFESYNYIRSEYRLSLPIVKNGKIYYFKNAGLQNHAVLYAVDLKTKEESVVLDVNTFSEDGTVSLSDLEFSESGKYLAYSISEGGSDWRKIIILDSYTLKPIEDTIKDAKFTSISWKDDDGFYYSSYDKPEKGSVLSGITDKHKVFYHKLGTPQSADILIFGKTNEKRRYVDVSVFKDSEYLFLSAAESTSGQELYVKKINEPLDPFIPVVEGFENDHVVIHAEGDDFYIFTNDNAPNGRIIKTSVNNFSKEDWIEVVKETGESIESVNYENGYIYVHYLKDAVSKVDQYDLNGKLVREVKLPGIGSVTGFYGSDESDEVYYSFETFTRPFSIYSLNSKTGESVLFKSPDIKIDINQYETKQVFYTSKDGTRIPMFIVSKKGTKLNSNNPTLLYGYGGFKISLPPYFSIRWLSWLDMGGVLAIPNLRGGGEYGEKWHEAGMQMNKQNVFDDFIAAAEYLQSEKYTSREKLTIMGGSNGGLLVGAVMTQRPHLMKVTLPAVGVLDMLRYHKFTSGAGWIADYGCADSSKAMFEYLYSYSPVQNVKEDSIYPATLVTTGDHDDRVVPAHSFKFIAHLQDKHKGESPVLIRIETKGGHGAGKSTSMFLDELADEFAFAFYNMNASPVYFNK